MKRTHLYWISVFLLGAMACHPKGKNPTEIPEKTISPEELLALTSKSSSKLQSLIGQVKVDYFDRKGGAGGRIKGKSLFMIEREKNLRFDVLTPFDQPLAILVSNGSNFALLDLQKGVFYQGPPTEENIARLFQIQFSDEDIVRALLGETPLLGDPESEKVSYDKKRNEWVLERTRGILRQTIRYEGSQYLLQTSTLEENDKVIMRITYDKYKAVENLEGTFLPHEVFFEKPEEKADIVLKVIGDIEINGETNPVAFTLQPPAGIEVVNVP